MVPDAESVITFQETEKIIRFFRFIEYSVDLNADPATHKLYDLDTVAAGGWTWKILKVHLYNEIKPIVAITKMQNVRLPIFFLRNECIWDMNICGKDPDVDFKEFPSFSKRFFLTGPDHEAIRNHFTPAVLSRFDPIRKIAGVAQTYRNYFAYHWPNRTVGPENYQFLAKEASLVLSLCLPC